MKKRVLGKSGLEVSAIGFGCMGISFGLGKPLEKKDGIALLRDAFRAVSRSSIPQRPTVPS